MAAQNDAETQAAIAAEIRRLLAEQGIQAPEPPRELSPHERVHAALDAARRELRAERTRPTSSDPIHYALLGALDALAAVVAPINNEE